MPARFRGLGTLAASVRTAQLQPVCHTGNPAGSPFPLGRGRAPVVNPADLRLPPPAPGRFGAARAGTPPRTMQPSGSATPNL